MAYVAESYYGDILSFYREEVGEKEYDRNPYPERD